MSHASFQIVYDGPALASNEMDARSLSAALLFVTLREVTYQQADGKLRKEYDIVKVLEVIKPPEQIPLIVAPETKKPARKQPRRWKNS